MRSRDRQDSRSGVSLIEVVVALMIFSLCISGFCSVAMQSRQLSDLSRDHYIAVNMARSRFERARSFDYEQLHLFEEGATVVDKDGTPESNGRFRRSTVVSNVTPQLSEMVVTVDILNRMTLEFDGEKERLNMYFADYVEPPE